jgi:hypothetical protein
MNAPIRITSLLAVGLAGLLTSCMDPYYAGGATTTTSVTHYRPGYVVDRIPGRYDTEVIGGVQYYRYDNVYYRPQGSRYIVVETPRGSRGYGDRDGRRYDGYDNRRDDYRDGRRDYDYDRRPGYDRSETTVVRTLPSGARVVTHRGTRYYQSGNVYYQPRGDGYVIVRSPF